MQRRDLLKGTGALATLAVGGTGLAALTGGVGASTADNFTIDDAAPVTTVDGTVEYVQVSADHKVVWEGFDVPVAAVAWKDELVKPSDDTTALIYDGTANPVRLADFSKQGSSTNWGGAGEYASKDPASYVDATGPTKEGFVHADIKWRVLSSGGDIGDALSVENPAPLDDFGIEQPTDGEQQVTNLEYHKTLALYKEDGSGGLTKMGKADGTYGEVTSVASFAVTVTNEPKSTASSGTGSSSTGT